MLELLILISYLNLSNFPGDIYYQEEITGTSSLSDGFLMKNYFYNGFFLYSEPSNSIEEWSYESFNNNFRTLLAEKVKKAAGKTGAGTADGLIPDIDLDLKMPRGLAYIIGEGGNLKVNGFQEIDVELKQNRQTYGEFGSYSSFPQIILGMRLKYDVNGTIGEKVHVAIDHDSDLPEQDNLLKIWYGSGVGGGAETEDDIIQELHLGRISETGSEKMFGIATRGKLGSTSFDLSAGKLESDEISGSDAVNISSKVDSLFEMQYLRDEYFYTGLPHKSDSLIEYGLYTNMNNDKVNSSTLLQFNGDTVGQVPMIKLEEEKDYELRELVMPEKSSFPYFHIFYPYSISQKRLGVYLIFADSTGRIDTLGKIKRNTEDSTIIDSLTLYQLKSINPDPEDPSWDYQMRNVYALGSREPSDVEVEIYKRISAGNNTQTNSAGVEYAELLGITYEGGKVNPSRILWEEGHLVFPDPFPFLNPGLGEDTVPKIYRQKTLYQDEGQNFYIVIKTTSSTAGNFRLKSNGLIIEESEILRADGETLQRGNDYKINYFTGEVELLHPEQLPPDAKITYEFKSRPFISFNSKYKAQFNIKTIPIKDSRLDFDFDFLSRSNKTVYHPSVGQEPSNITLGKVDFSLDKEPEFLNRVFNNLPFVDEDSKSHFDIDGTYGFSKPNPATNGETYLDDMESVDLPVPVDLNAQSWHYSSLPDSSFYVNDLAKLDWFTNSYYSKSRIFSEYSAASYSENQTSVMVLYFQPEKIDNWGGIMRTFSDEENLSQQNFLEVWIKADEGEMFFEMGDKMDEDQIRWGRSSSGVDSIISSNGLWDVEDKNGDGEIQPGEDTGFDGVQMKDENWVYNKDNYDYGMDDYAIDPETLADSLKTHNKEGNKKLDSEDLNGDYTFGRKNSFFRYKIDLSSRENLAKEGLNGWKVFVIPLQDSSAFEKIGNPSFESIEYTRIWFKGMNEDTRITIAKIDIVGSRWKDKGVRFVSNDSLNVSGGYFKIGYRNDRIDDDYISPVEKVREPGSYVEQKEQSMSLQIDSLLTDNYCLVENYLELLGRSGGRGYDFRLYKELNFYITLFKENTIDSAEVFIRLLTDSLNYYQFKTFAYKNDWDTVRVFFDSLTDLKNSGDTLQGRYSLKGNPSLQSIAFLELGVANKASQTFKGEVLIDDIILKGADDRLGSDLDLSVSTNVGDLITGLTYNISRKSSNYKNQLSALRELGDRATISQGFRITADAGKFLNKFISFPVTYSVSESQGTPVYMINSDIMMTPEEAESLANERFSRDITFNISRPASSDNWFLKHTVDNLSLSGSYREIEKLTPLKSADTTVITTGSINYGLKLPKISSPVFADNSSSLLPSNIGFKTSYEYSESQEYDYKDSLYEEINVPLKKDVTSYATLTYEPIRWIDVDYSFTAKNDLSERESFSENSSLSDLGQVALIREEISASHRSNLLGVNNLNVTYRTSFSQNHEIDYARTLGDSLDVRKCSQQRTLRISDDLEIGSILGKVPVVSGLAKKISPVRFSANFNKEGAFAYLNSMPGYKFRYGIENLPEPSLFERVEKTDGGYFDRSYSVSSGFSYSIVTLKLNWRFSHSTPDELKKENTQSPKETFQYTTFPEHIPKFGFFPEINIPKSNILPEVDIEFPNIQKYVPFLDNYVRRATLSFSVSQDSSSTEGIGNEVFSSGEASFDLTSGLEMSFKNGLGVTISPQYSENRTYPDSKLNTWGKSVGMRVNFNYTLKPSSSGFPLLFFGRVKFDKPVILTASFNYRESEAYESKVNGEETLRDNTRKIEFEFRGDYTFSNTMSGGVSINYENYLNRRLDNMSSTSYGGTFNIKLNF